MPWRYVVADNQYYARWPFSVPRYVNLGYSVCCIDGAEPRLLIGEKYAR